MLYPAPVGMADLVLNVDAEVGERIFGLACAATDRDDGSAHGRELIATAELRKVSLDARSGQVLHVDDQLLRPTAGKGSTDADNLAPRSRRHHRAEQAGWTPSALHDGSTLWSTPSGRTCRKPPTR